jgi:hypothetical protein
MSPDHVEVVYDHVTGDQKSAKQQQRPSKPTYSSNHGNAPYVDFENVFDPFERDDDVREFFDDDTNNPNRRDTDLDVENPFRIFHDPKVR